MPTVNEHYNKIQKKLYENTLLHPGSIIYEDGSGISPIKSKDFCNSFFAYSTIHFSIVDRICQQDPYFLFSFDDYKCKNIKWYIKRGIIFNELVLPPPPLYVNEIKSEIKPEIKKSKFFNWCIKK